MRARLAAQPVELERNRRSRHPLTIQELVALRVQPRWLQKDPLA
jgi:hypothetical protein